MATTQDILQTLVRLDGGGTYVSGMRAIAQADRDAAEKHMRLLEQYRKTSYFMAGIATASVGAIAYLGKQADAFDRYRNKLEIATKDTEKAKRIFDWSTQFANVTPFDTGSVVDAAARLEMYGLSAQKWLPMVGDMAGAMGRNVTDAVEAVADAVQGGGLERLKEFGITSIQLKKAGWTGSYQDTQGLETLKTALADIMSDRYMGGTARMANTLSGRLSTLRGEADTLAASFGDDLKPELIALTDTGIKFLRWLKDLGPTGKRTVTDLLTLGAVGGVVGTVVVKYRMMQAQLAMNRALTQQAAAAEREHAAAMEQSAAAAQRKTGAMAGGGISGGLRGLTSGLGRGGFGTLPGNWGIAQQTLGFTMGLTSLSRIDWGGDFDAASENVQNLGRMAGYTAGAFNPLILGATAAADALGRIVEAAAERKLERMTGIAEAAPGIGPGGKILTPQEIQDQIAELERAGMRVDSGAYIRAAQRNQEDARRKQARAEFAQAAGAGVGDIETSLSRVGYRRGIAQTGLTELQDMYRDPGEVLANYGRLSKASRDLQATLNAEASLHREAARLLRLQADATGSAADKANLSTDALKHEAAAVQSAAEARKVGREALRDYQDAQKKTADEQRKAAEEALRQINDAQSQRISTAQAYTALVEAMYGKESDAAEKAHKSLGQLLSREAVQAAQMGDMAKAYQLAAQAVRELNSGQQDLLTTMDKSIRTGDAYAQYLESIGMASQADQYRRNVLAGQQAGLARQLFGRGKAEEGWRAAAAAEKLARAGDRTNGNLFGDMGRRRGALTNAVDPSVMQAMGQRPIIVQTFPQVQLQDGFVNADRIKVHNDKAAYYQSFAQ